MSAQLEQILAYLDRPGVTEVVVGNGRPITFRRNHENIGLTKEPLSKQQLGTLLKGTTLLHLIPHADGTKPSVEIEIGGRQLKVTASRRGDEIAFRLETGDPVIELSPELPGRAKRATRGVRTTTSPKTAPIVETVRAARTTTNPRAARTTTRPRTKTNPAVNAAPALEGLRTKRQTRPAVTAPIDIDIEFDIDPPRPPPAPHAPHAPHAAPAPAPTLPSATRPKALSAAFQAMVERAAQRNASDLHIATNRPVSIRVLGELTPIDPAGKPISAAEVKALLEPLLSTDQQAELERVGYVDLALETAGAGRLRTNISKFQGGLKGTFRIPRKTPATLDELNLPKDLAKLVQHHQGLIVVAGPSGHGKTTTLAALVDLINASRPFHIITVEDPIEIVYPRKAAVVSQREVGAHTKSFAAALKGSLREDPDVIVIGELRDRETVEIALTAAETGHLVIATMSTPSAAKTIDRLVDMFPPEDQSQVRASIAGALRAIVAQRLVPSAKGDAVYAAVEVLTGVLALSAMIRDDKLFQLPNLMQRGKAYGMIRFDDSLTELVRSGKITADAAIAVSDNKKELTAQLKGGAPGASAKPPEPPPGKRAVLGSLFGRKDS